MTQDRPTKPWWAQHLVAMEEKLVRFLRRRLPQLEAEDALAAVRESVVRQMQTPEFAAEHPSWLQSTHPDPVEILEFDQILWRLARLRQLDQLRGIYSRRTMEQQTQPPISQTPNSRLEAREYLRLLMIALNSMPEEERELIVRDIDPQASIEPLSNAERVRVHRLRNSLAKQIFEQLFPRGKGHG